MIKNFIKNLFYKKPQNLGEGLARIKKQLGVHDGWPANPGCRKYFTKKNHSVSIFTREFKDPYKSIDGYTVGVDVSQLNIEVPNKNLCYQIDYRTYHDHDPIFARREVKPARDRFITKIETVGYKSINLGTIAI